MPRFPIYEPDVGLDIGSTPRVDLDAAPLHNLTILGQGLADFGRAFTPPTPEVPAFLQQHFEERQKRQDLFDDQGRAQNHLAANQAFTQEAIAAMPPQARGFHDGLLAAQAGPDLDLLKTVTPGNRPLVGEQLIAQRERTSAVAAQAEVTARARYEASAFTRSTDLTAQTVLKDADAYAVSADALEQRLAAMSSVPAEQRAALRLQGFAALGRAYWQNRFGADPVAGAPVLGITPASEPAVAEDGNAASAGDGMAGESYYTALRTQESGGRTAATSHDPTSGKPLAFGLYQFTPATWAGLAKAHPDLGLTGGNILDSAAQERAVRALTADNDAVLAQHGLPLSDANRYMAHFLGAGGAVRFLTLLDKAPGTPAAALLPAAARANPSIFYQSGSDGGPRSARSLADVYALQTRRFETQPQPYLGYEVGEPTDPRLAALSGPERIALYNRAIAAQRQDQAAAQARLAPQIDTLMHELRTAGRPVTATVPSLAEFIAAQGPTIGPLQHRGLTQSITEGGRLAGLRYRLAALPAEFNEWQAKAALDDDTATAPLDGKAVASRDLVGDTATGAPADAANGSIVSAAALDGTSPPPAPAIPEDPAITGRRLTMQQRVVDLMHQRRQYAIAFLIAGHPKLGEAWSQAETSGSASDLSAAIRLTASLADLDGIPDSERRFLSAPFLTKAMQTFADTTKPLDQRLAPLALALRATPDPAQRQAMLDQFVTAGLPPMLRAAGAAYARGDDGAAGRIAAAVLGRPEDTSKPTAAAAATGTTFSVGGQTLDDASLHAALAANLGFAPSATTPPNRDARGNGQLFQKLVRDNLLANGNDFPAAASLAKRDLFGTREPKPGEIDLSPDPSIPARPEEFGQGVPAAARPTSGAFSTPVTRPHGTPYSAEELNLSGTQSPPHGPNGIQVASNGTGSKDNWLATVQAALARHGAPWPHYCTEWHE